MIIIRTRVLVNKTKMNELEILEEDIKRKMKAIADGFCPSHPNIRISKTNMFGFKKTMECSLCSVARQKMIEQISNNGRNSSHNGNEISSVASKLASNSAIQRIYQTDEALANSSAKYVVQYSNGDFYEGGLLDNKRNGIGVWILSNGDRFDGSFYNDKMHGDGTYSYLNGDAYCGTYSQGKKHGKGTYKWANGDTYEATFINGREDGNGVYLWNSNAINVSIDSVEGHQQAVAGNEVAVTGDANVWDKGAEESANQIREGSIDESWSVGAISNDLGLQERKNDAYMEVLQSAYDATREDSSTDRGSTRHCSPAYSAAKGFAFDEDANQLEVLAQHGEGSGSGATEGDGGPSDFDPCIEEPPLVLNSVSSDDFYQPCLFDKEVDANEPDQDCDQPPHDLPLGRSGDGLLEQDLPDSCLQMMRKGSDEMKAFFVREYLAGRDVAIEAAIVRIVMELIDERCNENSFVLSETEIASREDSISDYIGTYSTDMILESVDELAWELSGELVVAESEYFVAATQHISACLLHEEIEFLLHVLVGPRLDELNSSIDRGFEYASLEMIEDSVRTHLTDIALEDISEREVSIVKGIELAFESLGAETSSEDLLPMAQGYLSARDTSIEITTEEVSWLVMLEVVAGEIEVLGESSIKERKKFDSTASQVALEEVGDMLSAEIAVVANTSLSEWENVIAGAIVGVHLRLIDEVVETYSKDFTSEELLSRECAIAGGMILLSNEILATATDKELNEMVVCLAAQRITSMQAAMEYIHEQEILQTVVQYTTELVSEQLESFDISIKAAEEWIVSAESDALVHEALLEVAGYLLDARTLAIESAFHGISADLVSEVTTTTMRDTIAQEVAWDFQLWDLYEDVISWVERDACTEVAQAAVSSLEKLLDIIVLDVYDDLVLDCIREDCACEISLESLLHESADFLAVTSIDEVTFQIAEVIAREVLSLRVEIVLDCAAEFASALTAEVVQESATDLSGAVRLATDNRTLIESFLNEVIKQACTTVLAGTIKALPVYYNANLESSRTNKSGAVDPSNSVMDTDSGPKYVEVVTEGNIIAAVEHDTALECGIGEGTDSQADSIHFHTPQFHSIECMEGEYSAVASEVEFGSCFDGIAGSYTGTITSKPMAVSALGSSESSSVGNYSADVESSFTSVGEDERTLNSEVAEVISFMKRPCDLNSEYSADGENSEQCLPLHNDDRFYSGYQWSVAEYQHKKDDVDLTEYNRCVSENCNTNEATMGICIRTSSSGDRIMEGVSIDKIYMQESPKEREWMVSPLADGVKEGQLYRSRSQEASDSTTARVAERMQPRSAEGEARKRASSRYSVVQSLNGDVYEGAVSSDGLFNGYGKLKFFNGDFYEGNFLNGYRSGTGMYQYSNGDTYEGSFKNGCKDGKGVYHYKDSGAVYQGSYVNDRRHGNGIYSYPNGGKFIGEYINGKKTAGGIYILWPVKS